MRFWGRQRNQQALFELDTAMWEATRVVEAVLTESADQPTAKVAEAVVDELVHIRPDLLTALVYPPASRAWYLSRDQLLLNACPWFMRGCDEFGNDTVAFRVPFGGQLVLATTWPLRRVPIPLNVDPETWLAERR